MAAGLGFKTFNTGDVLTAADVNGYLMQGVLVFANATARDAAITSPQEGQFAYTKDDNSLWYYTGSAWAASGATGDIEGVTAGVGISGGGTTGTVTITNSMATAIDAKGDLIVGTGADTFSRLAVGGTNGHVLTVDSTESTGMKWAAAAGGGGKVLQVIQATHATSASSSSTSYADTGLSATITPSAASSKILIMTSFMVHRTNANTGTGVNLKLLVGSTDILQYGYVLMLTNTTLAQYQLAAFNYLHSPNTTSATTYKVQFANFAASAAVEVFPGNTEGTMILMEIGA